METIIVGKSFYSETSEFVKWGVVEKGLDWKIRFYFISSKLPEIRKMSEDQVKELHDVLWSFNSYKEMQDWNKNNIGVQNIYLEERMWEKISKILKSNTKK